MTLIRVASTTVGCYMIDQNVDTMHTEFETYSLVMDSTFTQSSGLYMPNLK